MEERVKLKNKDGEVLVGIFIKPKGEGRFPCVLLVHGFHYFKEEDGLFLETAKQLSEQGIASYMFDFSGCGESEGDYSETTLTKLKDDLEIILGYITSNSQIDRERVGIFAQSFGTTVTIALSPNVKSIVLTGAFLNPQEVFKQYFGDEYNPEGTSTKKHDDGRITHIKPKFWKDFRNYDLIFNLKSVKNSLLLIYGSEDDTIPFSSFEDIYKNANQPKEKLILEGADHGLEPKRNEVYKIVVDWFKRTL